MAAGTVHPVTIAGPAGAIEALWKEPEANRLGSAVVAHAHPLHGGTMHFKVVFRIARALSRAGFGVLRFNFRGVGASAGIHDFGVGER
jgi:alpha/beta superfamily hydrolase